MSFEALKEIFNLMTMPVDSVVEGRGLVVELGEAFAGNGAPGGSMLGQGLAKGQAVEALVAHEMNVSEGFEHLARCGLIMQITRGEDEGAEVSSFIHSGQELGGHASAREADGFCRAGLFAALQAVLVELEVAAIDMPQSAFGLLGQPREQRVPDAATAPAAELRIDRAPQAKPAWQLSPRRPSAQDEEEGVEMIRNNFGLSPASPGPFSAHYTMNEQALSRRSCSRRRVSLLNMLPPITACHPRLSRTATFCEDTA